MDDKLTPEQHHAAGMASRYAAEMVGELATVRWSGSMGIWEQELHLDWVFNAYDRFTAELAKLPRPVPRPDEGAEP